MDWARMEFYSTAGPLLRYSRLLRKISKTLRCGGVRQGIEMIKSRRQRYLQYLGSTPGSPEEGRLRLRMTRVWGHKAAAVLLKREPPVIRMVLTVFTALRSFHLPVEVDVTSITGPSKVKDCPP